MSLKSKAISGFFWSFFDKVGNNVIHFCVLLFLANVLGPEAFGLVGMLAVFVAVADSLVNSGFSQALIQRSKRATEDDFNTIFYVNIAIGVVLYLILFFSAPYIAQFYGDERLTFAAQVLFLSIVINAFSVVARATLTIEINFKSQMFSNTFATIAASVVGISMALLDFGYWSIVGLTLTRCLLDTALLLYFAAWKPRLAFSIQSLETLFSFGSKILAAGLVATIVNNLYVVLIGRFFDSTRVGYLTQATNLTNTVSKLITSLLQGVTYPIMTSVNDDEERMISIYKQLIQLTFFVTVPAMAGLAAVSSTFTDVFLSEEWAPIVPILALLALARLITPISAVNMNLLNAIGRSDLYLKIDLMKLPLTLTAVIISAPLGVNAVAMAILTTSIIAYFINAYYPGKFFKFGAIAQFKATWRILLSGAIMYGSVTFISLENEILTLILQVTIGALIYFASCFFMREPSMKQVVTLLKRAHDKKPQADI